MARKNILDVLVEHYVARKQFISSVIHYVSEIKKVCTSIDPDCRVLLFGSFVRGGFRPDSDVDVLLITKHAVSPWFRASIYVNVAKTVGFEHPFQLHVVTPEEYEKWYKKFIDVYIEV